MAHDQRELRLGVIGAGGMGREHVTNLGALGGVAVQVVADLDAGAAEAAAAICGAAVSTDPFGVASDSSLDAVVIASPDETHADLTIAALTAGIHVLCEKPLASSVDDAIRVVDAENAAGRPLVQVGFMRQYDTLHRQVAAELAAIGDVLHLRSAHRNTNATWQRSLEVVCSQSLIHDVHTARWLTGSEFDSVVTQVVSRHRPVDHVVVLGVLANGASVTIEFVEATYGYDIELEVTAESGVVSCAQPAQPAVRSDGAVRHHIGDDWFGRFTDAYRVEIADWVGGVRDGVVRGPTASDGLAAQRVVAAAIESARTGARVPVRS